MDNIAAFLKLPPYIFGALAIASGIVLFLPDTVIEKLYLSDFRKTNGFQIGIVFLVSVSIITVLLIIAVYKMIKGKYDDKKLRDGQLAYLRRIDGNKVELIKYLINEPTNTATLPVNNGIVAELQAYFIITQTSSAQLVDMSDPQMQYFLQPWVIRRIDEDPELRVKFGR